MARQRRPIPIDKRPLIPWDCLYDKARPKGPGVMIFSPDHLVMEAPKNNRGRVRLTDFDDAPYSVKEVRRCFDIARDYMWAIDLDERGYFSAHVEDSTGTIVFSCNNEEEDGDGGIAHGELWLTADGFMRHIHDVAGLTDYLRHIACIGPLDTVVGASDFQRRVDTLEARHLGTGHPNRPDALRPAA
jgi:hypothetical protein